MDFAALMEAARNKLKPACRVCPVCDGQACAGEVPGMGGFSTGEAFKENLRALLAKKLNLRAMHNCLDPSTETEFFGIQLKIPIMSAPMANSKLNTGGGITELEMIPALVEGSHLAGSLGWIGDPANPELFRRGLSAIKRAGQGVTIIEPRLDQEEILNMNACSNRLKARAPLL